MAEVHHLKVLRELMVAAIQAAKTAGEYVNNDFTIKQSYLPRTALKDMPAAGEVYIIGLASLQMGGMSRTSANVNPIVVSEFPIQVGLRVVPNNLDNMEEMDAYSHLDLQLRATARKLVNASNVYTWLRIEPLFDENKTPFHFAGLRDANLFEAYFTSYYKVVFNT